MRGASSSVIERALDRLRGAGADQADASLVEDESLAIRVRADEIELLAPGSVQAHVLNSSAEAIWELCDGERSLEAIAEDLGRRFEMAPEQIVGDIEAGVRALEEAGVLEL